MQAQSVKSRRGGTREGAGRKPAYGEPTKTIRVPESLVPRITNLLQSKLVGQLDRVERATLRPVAIAQVAMIVPSVGRRVRAGEPTSGDDYQDDPVELGRYLVRDPTSTFLIKVRGWSMRDAGIADGDELVVDRGVAPVDGRVVVAQVDGELTVKRLRRAGQGWVLQAANPESADVAIPAGTELHIWGVVTRIIRAI